VPEGRVKENEKTMGGPNARARRMKNQPGA